ncbi:hypothetical protein [uncultured Endozoicomonas sp.]|uniref:hypothetical protein n=1 Tax=uncultured Endozoicomonas sp. TaxID=432652 RepID=UPI002621E9F2|nr:hypothetical protein [uncultured Endozoicomonas sp.]
MQAIRIKNKKQLVANQQLRGQLAANDARKEEQKRRRLLHRLVVFLNRPGWDAL